VKGLDEDLKLLVFVGISHTSSKTQVWVWVWVTVHNHEPDVSTGELLDYGHAAYQQCHHNQGNGCTFFKNLRGASDKILYYFYMDMALHHLLC
jgi:hypothetical protein